MNRNDLKGVSLMDFLHWKEKGFQPSCVGCFMIDGLPISLFTLEERMHGRKRMSNTATWDLLAP